MAKQATPTRPVDDERQRYRRISVRINHDEKYRALSKPQPNGQSLFLHCIFGPETTIVPGLVIGGEMTLAESLGWKLSALRKCWAELESQEMAKADWPNRLVWLPNGIVHNQPESPNVCVAWFKALRDEIPPSPLREEARARMDAYMVEKGFAESFIEAFRHGRYKPSGKPSRNSSGIQEQEQEQEQKLDLQPSAEGDAVVLEFPTVGRQPTWGLHRPQLVEFEGLFPTLDVLSECRKALTWVITNDRKRKTARGMRAFLSRWLTNALDDPRAAKRPVMPAPAVDQAKLRYGGLRLGQ